MDIFTTVLKRVVPVPIKPASLKVKALLKEAKTSKLKEDPDHLENHDYYFGNDKNKQKESDQDKNIDDEQAEPTHVESASENDEGTNNEDITVSEDGIKHLDLYV